MKKVLALVVAFALCITAVAGCFSVSATAPVFSVVAEGNVVTVSGTIAENTNYAVLLKITLDKELSLASVKDGNDNTLTQWSQTVEDNREEWHYVYNETNKVISSLELYDNTFTYVITVNAPVNESCKAASAPYTVSVVAEYADYDASAPSLEQYQGSADVVVPAADHTPAEAVVENEVAADCVNAGSYDTVVYCSVCNAEISRETVTVDALGHTPGDAVIENEVAADCDTDGSYDSVIYCTVCDAEISREAHTTPATGHTPAEAVVENEVAADCVNAGSYDTVVYCSVCNAEISRDTTTVDALGHTPGEPVEEDGFMVTRCSVCDAELSREAIEVEPTCLHENKTIVSATPATETENGLIDYDCPDCDNDDEIDQVVYYIRFARTNSISVSGESEILYCVGVRDADAVRTGATGSNETWSDMFVKFTEARVGEDDVVTYMSYNDKRVEDTTMGTNAVMKFSYGVAPKFLGNVITTNTFIYNDKDAKWYSGTPSANSVKDYVGKSLPNATNDEQKTLLIDLLNYGAAAQIKFKYDVENLVNASFVWNNVDYSEYATEELVSPIVYQGVLASSSTEEYPLTVSSFGVQAESKLVLTVNFQFGNKYYANYTSEYENMYVEVSYTDIDGVLQTVTYYNAASNPDAEYTFSSTDNTRKFTLEFDSFAAADMRSVVTVKVYTGEGTLLNSTSEYSIQSYVYSQNDKSTDAELLAALEAMIIYGDSAKAFLSK